jgi:hypothetical protein
MVDDVHVRKSPSDDREYRCGASACHVAHHSNTLLLTPGTATTYSCVQESAVSPPHFAPHHVRAAHERHPSSEARVIYGTRQLPAVCLCVMCAIRLFASVDERCLTSCCCMCASVRHLRLRRLFVSAMTAVSQVAAVCVCWCACGAGMWRLRTGSGCYSSTTLKQTGCVHQLHYRAHHHHVLCDEQTCTHTHTHTHTRTHTHTHTNTHTHTHTHTHTRSY